MKISFLSKWALLTLGILLIPLLAHWPWSLGDFIFATILIYGSGLTYYLITKKYKSFYKYGVVVGLIAMFLLIWINGAVGIIGSEDELPAMLYVVVVAIIIIGGLLTRFKAGAMSKVMICAAIVQAIIPIIAFFLFKYAIEETPGVLKVCLLNTFFVVMFIASGLLFKKANKE